MHVTNSMERSALISLPPKVHGYLIIIWSEQPDVYQDLLSRSTLRSWKCGRGQEQGNAWHYNYVYKHNTLECKDWVNMSVCLEWAIIISYQACYDICKSQIHRVRSCKTKPFMLCVLMQYHNHLLMTIFHVNPHWPAPLSVLLLLVLEQNLLGMWLTIH